MQSADASSEEDGALQIAVVIFGEGKEGREGFFTSRENAFFPFAVQFDFENPFFHVKPPGRLGALEQTLQSNAAGDITFLRIAAIPSVFGRPRAVMALPD